jgi:hypothetical protein
MHKKINFLIILTLAAVAGLLISAPARVMAATGTLDIRVNHDDDTNEERVVGGATDWHSSDLELGAESGGTSGLQIVGVRFLNVSIPQGAIITNAFIEFTTDETDSEDTDLVIEGEADDNAARFTNVAGQMATRTRTTASVAWDNVPAWGTVGETGVKQQTPDVKTIVQEIVDRSGWAGNAMVFFITGTGKRVAESAADAAKAPILHVEYTTESVGDGGGGGGTGVEATGIPVSGSLDDAREAACATCDNGEPADYVRLYRKILKIPDDASEPIGLRFQNVNIPRGTIITNAYLEFTNENNDDSGVCEWVITGQAADNPGGFDDTVDNISDRPRTGQSVSWTTATEAWVVDQKYQSPDISSVIQEIVGRAGWNAGNNLVLIIDSPTEKSKREPFSYDGAYASAADNGKEPKLYIEYGNETGADVDSDGDGYLDSVDNCPLDPNPDQGDIDGNGVGDFCDLGFSDTDGDSIDDMTDNCVDVPNPGQQDADGDGIGDACDTAPYITIDNENLGTSCYEGETANNVNFKLTNSGGDTLNYTVTVSYNVDDNWILLSPAPGSYSLAPSASQTYVVGFNNAGLTPGIYDAKITIADPSGAAPNSPEEILVSLTVFTMETADNLSSSCGHVPLYVDNMVNPAILILLDVSSSMSSSVDVTEGDPPQTPPVKDIVQEIVDRGGWQSGNSMVFLIEGSGDRKAQSYNNSSGSAPLLYISYSDGIGSYVTQRRVDQSSDDAEQAGDGTVLLSANMLDMMGSGSNTLVGMRFRNVNVPQGATITDAYLEFTTAESASTATTLTIYGQDYDNPPTFATSSNNLSNRIKTSKNVSWSPEPWGGITQEKRVEVGKDVIAELVKDRSIAWGFGSWCEKKEWRYDGSGDADYSKDDTLILAGTKPNSDTHQANLQRAIFESTHIGGTPFIQSIMAAKKYFAGQKAEWEYVRDDSDNILDTGGNVLLTVNGEDVDRDNQGAGAETGDTYTPLSCQPKFLIDITDGRGDDPPSSWHTLNPGYETGTDDEKTAKITADLADAGVTPIAVGFDLDEEDAGMLFAMSKAANEKGNVDPDDNLYALHREVDGVGQPFFAYNKQELVNSLRTIAQKVKGAVFTGSAPAPTTSADLGDTLIVAEFDPGFWSGDLKALTKIDKSGGWTDGNVTTAWVASGMMPAKASRNVWTIDPASPYDLTKYTDAILTGDNWLCKSDGVGATGIGDIINSTPVVVGTPPFFYNFDAYLDFKTDIIVNDKRPKLIYVGANDGALHAFALDDYTPAVGDPITAGEEVWAFVPKSLQAIMNKATADPVDDMCADEYCHKYLLDGSPKVADIAHDFDGDKTISSDEWRTILVTGLRAGGQAYFALDVTSGQDFDPSNSDPAKHLWEFIDNYDLGESWSEPSINRVTDVSSDPVKEAYYPNRPYIWATYFGSGYSPHAQTFKESFLYGIEAYDASDLWSDGSGGTTNKIQVGSTIAKVVKVKNYPEADPSQHFAIGETIKGNSSGATATVAKVWWLSADLGYAELQNQTGSFIDDEQIIGLTDSNHKADLIGNVSTIDSYLKNDALSSPVVADIEGDSIDDRIYVGNLYGNMYRVDDIGKGQEPVVSTLFDMENTTHDKNPIRAKADYAFAYELHHLWVYWGTGLYENQMDKTSLYSQYFFGLIDWNEDAVTDPDPPLPPHKSYKMADLEATDTVHTAMFVNATVNIDGTDVDKTFRIIDGHNPKDNPKPWAVELFANQADRGWTGALPAGSERVLVKPLVLGGVVFFVTFIPDRDVCAGNGESWLFAVDFETGLIPDQPVWDINGDGLYDANDMVKIGTDDDGNDIMAPPNGIFMGRGQASHLVYHDGYLFFSTTGSGDGTDGGVPPPPKPQLKDLKVRLRSWIQGS